jgi:hypothetical protein
MILKIQIFSRSSKASSLELAERFWKKDGPSKLFVAGLASCNSMEALWI